MILNNPRNSDVEIDPQMKGEILDRELLCLDIKLPIIVPGLTQKGKLFP